MAGSYGTDYLERAFLAEAPGVQVPAEAVCDDTRGLVRGGDGSLSIVVSASRPAETGVNWLPAPAGAFTLVLRVYDPALQVFDGSWSSPAVKTIS